MSTGYLPTNLFALSVARSSGCWLSPAWIAINSPVGYSGLRKICRSPVMTVKAPGIWMDSTLNVTLGEMGFSVTNTQTKNVQKQQKIYRKKHLNEESKNYEPNLPSQSFLRPLWQNYSNHPLAVGGRYQVVWNGFGHLRGDCFDRWSWYCFGRWSRDCFGH